ncbi:hypothetical protein BOX15_Mlig017060g2, partial [Macrostomum lignano]
TQAFAGGGSSSLPPGGLSLTEISQKLENQKIPIVTHIISDEDIGNVVGEKLQTVDLERVLKVLTDPHYAGLYDRHVMAIERLLRHYKQGFLMKDLVQVRRILNICADRIEEGLVCYVEPLVDCLCVCALPFLMEKASDELAYRQISVETASQLAFLMRVDVSRVRLQICRTLAQIYDGEPPPQDVRDHKPAGRKYNQAICEESDISETLVRTLKLLDKDLTVRLAVISLLQKLSGNSTRCCIQMLSVNAAYTLCSRMTDPDPSGELLFRSVEILWNLMQHGDSEQVAKQLACQECVAQLREAFVYLLPRTFSVFDRQLRNDVLVLVQLLAATDCRAPFIEVGFLKQLTLFATFEEVKSHSPLVRNLKLSKNHEDFELKKLLISTLVSLSSDPCALPVLSEGHFMLALLSYVKPNEPTSKPRELPPAYVEELQLLALSALATVGPKMQADFVSCNGCNRLLELLFWCTEASDDYLGYGNAFHGAGGRGSKRAQMRRTLRAISAMVTTNNPDILADFVDQDAIGALSEILASSVSAGNRTGQAATAAVNDDDTIDLEMKREMLGILSGLCENSLHNKDLFGPSGVATLVQFLRTDPGLLSSGLGHYQLVIGAIDAVWCCVVGSYTTEDCFLEREGVYLLLDLLERCPSDLHSLILGVLLDLSENEKTLPHLKTWKGGCEVTAPHLFCALWRDTEASIGCPRRPDGSIGDLLSPLMGDDQRKQPVTPQPANWPSRSIVEVAENVRAKIYALFYRIGFVDLPGINAEDHVTLTLIERYLDYKLGEVWDEVQRELELEQVRPVTPDREALDWINKCTEQETLLVAKTQSELMDAKRDQEVSEEQALYSELREDHRQKEKAINDFSDFVARTSDYSKLREAKTRQLASIEASRIVPLQQDGAAFHSTELVNLQATVFCNTSVKLQSTPADILGGHMNVKERLTSWMTNYPRGGGTAGGQTTSRSVEIVE